MANRKLTNEPVEVDASTISPLRLLVYADGGVGKTTLGLTFPRPVIVNTDFGLEGDALEMLKDQKGIEIKPEGYKDTEAIYYWIRDHAADFDTIILDSGDEIVRILLDELVKEGAGKRSADGTGLGETFFDVVPEQAEYLANQRQIHSFLTELRKLGKHMVVTFGVREGAGTQGRASFSTTPGLQKPLNHWSSVTGRLLVAPRDWKESDGGERFTKGQRILITDPASTSSMAKSRYGALVPHVVNPTFDKMWGAIEARRNQS